LTSTVGVPTNSIVLGKHMVGRAVTVRTYHGDWAKPVEAIDKAQPGDVIVIDAGSRAPAVWGELATESCLQRKLAGVVIDGAIRDVDAIRALASRLRAPAVPQRLRPGSARSAPVSWAACASRPATDRRRRQRRGGRVRARRRIANRALMLEMENRVRGEIQAAARLRGIELYCGEGKSVTQTAATLRVGVNASRAAPPARPWPRCCQTRRQALRGGSTARSCRARARRPRCAGAGGRGRGLRRRG
jgi:hypothetical protein